MNNIYIAFHGDKCLPRQAFALKVDERAAILMRQRGNDFEHPTNTDRDMQRCVTATHVYNSIHG